MSKTIPIIECFGPTIQGEGIMTGTITHFLRTGGCPLRCTWCDSMHAVLPEEVKARADWLEVHEILNAIRSLPRAPWITLTGGDPCMHKGLGDLISALQGVESYTHVAVETQGTLFPDWLVKCDVVTFSPKPPSSGNAVDIQGIVDYLDNVRPKHQRICIKVVVDMDDPRDFEYAMQVYSAIKPQLIEGFYFNACSPVLVEGEPQTVNAASIRALVTLDLYTQLAEFMCQQNIMWHQKTYVGCQQHVLLWPQHNEGV